MQCPKCDSEIKLRAEDVGEFLELRASCTSCPWAAYTSVGLDDLVEEQA